MISITRIDKFSPELMPDRAELEAQVQTAVREIIADVRANGDEALIRLTEKFDGVKLSAIEVPQAEIERAYIAVGEEFRAVLNAAADNIRDFHKRQIREGFVVAEKPGAILGQRVVPIASAGLYVPGGTAAYPSTVLMNAIPAKLAGVSQLIMTTPPTRGGEIAPEILAAAKVAGVDRVFKLGGAQAIAALAYGTASVPGVDKIVGPGNIYVAEAKRQVFGQVGIDIIAGPSEILIVADGASNPAHVAADMLSQAEHDTNACAILITDSPALAIATQAELETQLSRLPREEIARASIDNNGRIFITNDLTAAITAANAIAPEHLEICLEDSFAYLPLVTSAGSVFLGRYTPEALGDYFAGTNHTLPTGGSARFASPLSVDDFVKKIQFTYYTKDALANVADSVALFARREGLEAHARSAMIRRDMQ